MVICVYSATFYRNRDTYYIIHLGRHSAVLLIIVQVYRLSALYCQVTRYSQRLPGYLIRHSQGQPMKYLLTKNTQSHCLFQLMLGLEEHYSPSPLVTSTGFFEGLIGVLFKIWYLNMTYFLNGIYLAKKMQICIIDFLVKATWMQCRLHNKKVNKSGFHGASCQLTQSNIWTHKVLTNSSVLAAGVVYGQWRWQPQQNLLNSVFIPCMCASAIECRSTGSCSSSGLCAGLLITGFHFHLLFTLPPSATKFQ